MRTIAVVNSGVVGLNAVIRKAGSEIIQAAQAIGTTLGGRA
jgi:hypothetical protein